MPLRNNVKIKTKYNSKKECIENCLDYQGQSLFYSSYSRGIGGTMTKDGEFVISSKTKGSGIFEFIGRVEEIDGDIYLMGEIKEKALSIKIIYASITFMTLFGLLIIFAMAPLGVFIGPIFMIVPWFNLLYIKKSDALYNEIRKRVS